MKTIFDLCVPRDSVFQSNYVEDVISIDKLDCGTLNAETFFEETYITNGMRRLFDSAFRRYMGEDVTPIIRLKQAMGGGKSHNMVALALLAKNPRLRKKVLGDRFETFTAPVRVLSFYGRESDQCLWHSFAQQVGNRTFLERYHSSEAPGKSAWTELLSGPPTLILLDEMPPYLAYAETQPCHMGTLADVITHALNNLFTSIVENLPNVFLVISDLNAAYENGSTLIEKSFGTLNKELERHCQDIEPVQSNNEDVYQILRKKLFKSLPSDNDIDPVATEYRAEFNKARKANLVKTSGEAIHQQILRSYPFHPDLKKLLARIQCNQNFQQTRGILRLMRAVLHDLYENHSNENIGIISACHFDLNNFDVFDLVSRVMPALDIAVASDVAHGGNSIAEQKSSELQSNFPVYLARTIYLASLSEAVELPSGLTKEQAFEQVIYPGYVMQDLTKALSSLQDNAWYMHRSSDGHFLFRPVQNVTAQVNNKANSYNNQFVFSLLKKTLEERIRGKTTYSVFQDVLVYPGIDEIREHHCRDKVLLVAYTPYRPGLSPELMEYWKSCNYKNRILFLSAEKDTMESMYRHAKRMKACQAVESELRADPELLQRDDVRLNQLEDIEFKAKNSFYAAAKELLSVVYYPDGDTLSACDVSFDFQKSDFNFENALRETLISVGKYLDLAFDGPEDTYQKQESYQSFARRVKDYLFTQNPMKWSDVVLRSAENPSWLWYKSPDAQLNRLKDYMVKHSLWTALEGDYISSQKPEVLSSCKCTPIEQHDGKVFLRVLMEHGDVVCYQENGIATENSPMVDEKGGVLTNALWVSFLCVDTSGKHASAEPFIWQNTCRVYKSEEVLDDGKVYIILKSNVPDVLIKYSLDGSNLSDAGIAYSGPIPLPDSQKVLRAAAFPASDDQDDHFKADPPIEYIVGRSVDNKKKVNISRERKVFCRGMSNGTFYVVGANTSDTFRTLQLLNKHHATMKPSITISPKNTNDSHLMIDISGENSPLLQPDVVHDIISSVSKKIFGEADLDVEVSVTNLLFESGADFEAFLDEAQLPPGSFDYYQR